MANAEWIINETREGRATHIMSCFCAGDTARAATAPVAPNVRGQRDGAKVILQILVSTRMSGPLSTDHQLKVNRAA